MADDTFSVGEESPPEGSLGETRLPLNDDQKDEAAAVQPVPAKDTIRIIFVGKSGAGKSTLMRSLFDIDTGEPDIISSDSVTTEIKTYEQQKNDVTILATDTKGMTDDSDEETLKELAEKVQTQGKFDFLVFCLPIFGPGSRFKSHCPTIRLLQKVFGKNIWRHCLIAFTFSNEVLRNLKKKRSKKIESDYEHYLDSICKKFQDQLKSISDKSITVKKIFDLYESNEETENIILAIPAGDEGKDDEENEILPGFKEKAINITIKGTNKQGNIIIKDWKDVMFIEMVKKSNNPEALLKYRYNLKAFQAEGGAIGSSIGAVGGTILGALLIQPIDGLLMGSVIGGAVGEAVGKAVGGAVRSAKGIEEDEKEIVTVPQPN